MGRIYKLGITLTFIFIFLNKTDDFSCKNYNQFSHDNNKKNNFFCIFGFAKIIALIYIILLMFWNF